MEATTERKPKVNKKAQDLQAGDKVWGGTIVYVGRPVTYCGKKNQVRIDLRMDKHSEGEYSTRFWNANTLITFL